MKVTMLDTVEDSRHDPVTDEKGAVQMQHRVDVLRKGEAHELPEPQAKNLIKLKLAEQAKG